MVRDAAVASLKAVAAEMSDVDAAAALVPLVKAHEEGVGGGEG